MAQEVWLLSDVGGTKASFALYNGEEMSVIVHLRHKGDPDLLEEKINEDGTKEICVAVPENCVEYADYINLAVKLIKQHDLDEWEDPTSIAVGTAGVKEKNMQGDPTMYAGKLTFFISEANLKACGFDHVLLENDLSTHARAVKASKSTDFVWKAENQQAMCFTGNTLVFARGTGANACLVRETSKGRPLPKDSEAGFIPLIDPDKRALKKVYGQDIEDAVNALEYNDCIEQEHKAIQIVRAYLKRKTGKAPMFDSVVSGNGQSLIYHVFEYLSKNPNASADEFEMPENPIKGMAISDLYLQDDLLAKQTFDLWDRYSGIWAGTLANVHRPDQIVFEGGADCDQVVQTRTLAENGLFQEEYRRVRIKMNEKNPEIPMAMAKKSSQVFEGLKVWVKDTTRKDRDHTILSEVQKAQTPHVEHLQVGADQELHKETPL